MTRHRRLSIPSLLLVVLITGELAHAQGRGGGGRGRSEEVRSRLGNYFVEVALPAAAEDGTDRLAASAAVRAAADQGHLSLLYLFDAKADAVKHERFETTLFGNDGVTVPLRCFRCGRVDLAGDEAAMAEYGRKAPLFVAFDATGRKVGEVSMRGYKATASPLVRLLERAAKGHAKLPLAAFTKRYRAFLNDLQLIESKKRGLQQRRQRAAEKGDDAKVEAVRVDEEALAKEEKELLEQEKDLLETAGAAPRDPKAKRVGGQRRRGDG